MIDFTDLPQRKKGYGGGNGNKLCVVYNGELYMLKFPPHAKQNKNMEYSNSCFSEYLGCHIYESIGIPVQETILGTYRVNEKEKIVVACKDFTKPKIVVQDFAFLKNKIIDSAQNGYGTELTDIQKTISTQKDMDATILSDRFWNMFVVDTFIANWDRHNGNWGFLYNTETDEIKLAPVYDCGSALYAQADENIMESVLTNKNELNLRLYERPVSAILKNGERIKYFEFISSLQNHECNLALKRIGPKIDMQKIANIVENTPCLTDLQRKFYKTMLKERKEKILDFALNKLRKKEREKKKTHTQEIER